jgi:hypothetical protein
VGVKARVRTCVNEVCCCLAKAKPRLPQLFSPDDAVRALAYRFVGQVLAGALKEAAQHLMCVCVQEEQRL